MQSKRQDKVLRYNVIFEPCEEGGFVVSVPKLPGLVTEGDTYEEAVKMARDAISGYIQVLDDAGEKIPEPDDEVVISNLGVNVSGLRFAV